MTLAYSAFTRNGAKQILLSFELVAPPRVPFKNESVWPKSQLGVSYHLLPMERCVCGGRFSLASVSQPEVDYCGGARDRAWPLSAAELLFSGWQPAACCATILFFSWGSSDKLSSSKDGERSGRSTRRRCPSDSRLLGEPEDPAESSGDGSGSA